jgi:hypothetical protein
LLAFLPAETQMQSHVRAFYIAASTSFVGCRSIDGDRSAAQPSAIALK